jgi:hypothetical protein
MPYIIRGSDNHPFDYYRYKDFELFHINYSEEEGDWVRDDDGLRWGFNHPVTGEVVAVHPAGAGPVPNLGQISVTFAVIEVGVEVSAVDEEE